MYGSRENVAVETLPGYIDPSLCESEAPEVVYLLYGSVLEADLLPATLHLPQAQLCLAELFQTASPKAATSISSLSPAAITNNPFDLSAPEVQQALAMGQYCYVLTVHPEQDFAAQAIESFYTTLSTVGTFLSVYSPGTGLAKVDTLPTLMAEQSSPIYVLYGSVLELDLIAPTSGLPTEAITLATAFNLPDSTTLTVPGSVSPESPMVLDTATSVPIQSDDSLDALPVDLTKSAAPSAATVQDSIRVRVDLLNRLMNLAGEMVLLRNQLNQKLDHNTHNIDGLGTVLQNINHTTSELQEHIMQTRMQPIGNVFNKFHRVVRDVARALNKKIDIEISGDEVELDKSIVESLSDPLTHLIRNSCDHGIEPPEERQAMGKVPTGQIYLKAFQEGGQIIIAIQDDGRGIDADRLAQKALEKGILTQADVERMSTKDKVALIFHPGFSTAKQVSDISGRGVGMDVVRTNIEKLGGTIEVDTEVGMGTIIYLHLPLTLAIIPSLLVGVNSQSYAIPQINVVELIRVRAEEVPKQIETVGNAKVLRLRGKLLPLVQLRTILGIPSTYIHPESGETRGDRRLSLSERRQQLQHPEVEFGDDGRILLPRCDEDRRVQPYVDINIAVLKLGGKHYGLVVDEVYNLEEIVVKPLSQYLQGCTCFAGSTILGDGSVSMILDVNGVSEAANLDFSNIAKEEDDRERANALFQDQDTVKMDLIRFALNDAPDSDQFAVQLQSVLRLEKFNTTDIQWVGQREYLTYQGRSLPLIRLEHSLPVNSVDRSYASLPTASEEAYLILPRPKMGEPVSAAIVAQRIVDVDTIAVRLEPSHIAHPGVKGAAVVEGNITTFIEPSGFLPEVVASAVNSFIQNTL